MKLTNKYSIKQETGKIQVDTNYYALLEAIEELIKQLKRNNKKHG